MLQHGALAQCTLTLRWSQFWGRGSRVFSAIKLQASTVHVSIRSLHGWIGLDVRFAAWNEYGISQKFTTCWTVSIDHVQAKPGAESNFLIFFYFYFSFLFFIFYFFFALVSQICVRRDALVLFGLNDDELLPDLHITGAGVLRAGIGPHLEHVLNQDAQAADRKKVPAEVIQVASHEVDTDSDKDESIVATSGSEGSESASESEQNDPPSSLASDAEQYERMQASYAAVGRDFKDQEDFIGSEYRKLQRLELVPQRWPLARLSISLQKCVDHLDRVLAGCCWEVHATRADPEESLSSLRQVSKWPYHAACYLFG